jgi:hypothetical protein
MKCYKNSTHDTEIIFDRVCLFNNAEYADNLNERFDGITDTIVDTLSVPLD